MSVTPLQFKQMQDRLSGNRRSAAPVMEPTLVARGVSPKIILGLDPSLRGTGYGVIRMARPFPETLTHGTISCSSGWERSRCLVKIVQSLRETLKRYSPEVCVIE